LKYISIILFGLLCLLAGWHLHSFFYPSEDYAGKRSPAKELAPPRQPLQPRQAYNLGGYNAEPSSNKTNKANPSSGSIQALLQAGNYRDAVALYNQQLNTVPEQESTQSRRQILQYARERFNARSYSVALQLLNQYLDTQYRDVDALLLKAEVLARENDFNGQIDTLYDAKSYAYRQPVITRITDDIRNTVEGYRKYLLENRRYPELLDLYQKLVYLEPDYSPYFIELAKAQRANNLEAEAKQSLALVQYDPAVGQQAQRLLAESRGTVNSEQQDIAQVDQLQGIPLTRRGNHFVVEATLDGYIPLTLIIDTGASLTIIKTDKLLAVTGDGLAKSSEQLFNTANGAVKAPVLQVGSLAIGEYEVTNLKVGGLNLTNTPGVDGLLGMNFLRHYRFFIDQQNNLLRLSLNSEY
jgi:clan AA aspartic protease (TIGR02281 family)